LESPEIEKKKKKNYYGLFWGPPRITPRPETCQFTNMLWAFFAQKIEILVHKSLEIVLAYPLIGGQG
jgi:hypothetical protein